MWNSRRDSRKGGKRLNKYLGPYEIVEVTNKGIYRLKNIKTGKKLAKAVNVARFIMFKGTHYKVANMSSQLWTKSANQDDDNKKVECIMQEGNEIFGVLTNQLYCPHYL